MAGLHFDITGDNKNFLRKLDEVSKGVKSTAKDVEREGDKITDVLDKIGKAMGTAVAGFTIKEIVQKVAMVRSEFQKLEISFSTMLGDANKANELMSQLTRTAAITPFGLQDVAGGAKQLLAYGIAAKDVNDTLIRLGDIAAGLSIPLGDLVYLYGTTMAQGKLFTMDLRQFMGRGIPLAEELAKQFNVTTAEVGGLVTAGKVGFEEVKKAIVSMTSEGSKFGGLMEAQSKTIDGQISNIQDSLDGMLNEIGKSSEDMINAALGSVSSLIEHYKEIGEAIGVVVSAYGVYRGAIMANIAIRQAQMAVMRQAIVEKKMYAALNISLSKSELIASASGQVLRNSLIGVASSLKAVTAAALTNPYVLLATAITAVGYGLYKVITYQDEFEKAQKRLEEATSNVESSVTKETRKLAQLERKLLECKKGSEEYNQTKEQIVNTFGKYYKGLDAEIERVGNLSNVYSQLTENIRASMGQRMFSSFFDKEASQLDKDLSSIFDKVYSKLIDKWGEQEGKRLYKVFYESIMFNGTPNKADTRKLAATGSALLGDTVWADFLDARNLQKAFDKNIEKYKNIYQIKDDGRDKAEDNITKKYKTLSALISEIKDKESELKTIREKANKGEASKADIESKQKELEELKKEYKIRTGNEYGKVTQAEKTKQKQIEAEKKAGDKLLKLIQDNAEAEVSAMEEGKEKKLKALKNEYDERKLEIEKQVKEFAELNKKSGATGLDEQGLTQKQSKAISEALLRNDTQYQHDKKELEKQYENERIEALYNYLTKYGDVQEQIYAITTYYNQKIAEEKNAYNQASLYRERDEAIKNIQANEQRKDIDWSSMFGNIELYSVEKLQSIKEEIRKVLSEDNSLDVTDKKDLIEQYNRINDAISDATFNLAKFFGFESEESDRIRMLKEEYELRKQIVEKLKQQQELAKGKHTDSKNALDSFLISAGVVNANKDYSNVEGQIQGGDLETFKNLFAQFQTSSAELTQLNSEVANASQAMEGAGEAAQGAGQGFASAFAATDKIIHTVNANVQSTAEFMKEIGRENTKAGKFITKFAESSQYATDAFDALKSGNFAGVVTALHGALRTLGDSLGELGIAGFGNSDTTLHDDMERLSEQNKALADAMESLSEELKNANFSDSAEIFRTQLDYLEKAQDNRANLMLRSALAYNNGFLGIGGKSSSASKVTSGLSLQEWERLSEITGETVDSGTAFFKLSAEQMKAVATYAPDLYAKIKGLADEGYENASQYMDEYIAYGEELEKLQDAYNEKMTNISFDSFRDEFKGALTDMEMTAEKFAENFEELLVDAIAESLMTEKYDKKIKELYEKWVKYAEDGFTTGELADLQKDKSEIYDSMKEDRKFLDLFREGSITSQSANRKGLESLTHEQGDELNGRFTAVQLAGESIKESMLAVVGRVDGIYSVTTESNEQLKEIRNLVYLSTGYLEDIAKYSKPIGELGGKLDKIIENTQGLV